jgi:hypothetical protein
MGAALKTRFYLDKNTIPDMTYEESPAYATIPKSEDWGGDNSTFPIIIGNNQSHSATFAKAQANAGTLNIKKWLLPSSANKKHYTMAQIPGDLIRSMEMNSNAYFPAVEAEVESGFKTDARKLSVDLFGDGFGAVGVIATGGISGSTITLTRAGDTKKFEANMVVVFSQSNNGHVLRGTGATQELTVQSVDEDAGTVTFTAAVSTITGGGGSVAVGDSVFPVGDRQDSATPARLRMAGFEAWTPYDRTTLTGTFFNIDRTQMPSRLGGAYLDGSQKSITEAVTDMISLLCGRKGNPKYAWLSFSKWNELQKEQGSKVIYMDVKAGEQANINFSGIKFNGPKGPVVALPDVGCRDDRCFVTQPDTWLLLSLGKPIGFLDEDENKMLRQGTADSYEVRLGGYTELLCKAPGWNGVINL